MIRTDCYLAKLQEFKTKFPNAHFEVITRSAGHILSPSIGLLSDYRQNKINWETYTVRFIDEMFANDKAIEKIKELRRLAAKKDVYVVCYEKDANQCHRSIIAKLIRHEYFQFNERYSKLDHRAFTTIRDRTHGLIAGVSAYLIVQGHYYGNVNVCSIAHRSLDSIPTPFLVQDACCNTRSEAESKIHSIYPECSEFTIFFLRMIQHNFLWRHYYE